MGALKSTAPASAPARERDRALGVTVEAQYLVGEYDILILSAKESAGLETWLTENGYRIPAGASSVLLSYLKQGMKFFVAKVNLEEQGRLGGAHLRPLQIAFESPKFMMPIRLGTVNADGAQELFIYFLTKQGRVETTNYRTMINRVSQFNLTPLAQTDTAVASLKLHLLSQYLQYQFLRHDEESLRELTTQRKEAGYLGAVRQRIEELEQMLQADRAEPDLSRDAGWDADSLRAEFGKR